MASSIGSKIGYLIVGGAISVSALATIDTVQDSATNPQNQSFFTGDAHFITADNTYPAITLDGNDVIALSGSTVTVTANTGTGKIIVHGAGSTGSGGIACFEDRDEAGYTICSYLNGAQTCRAAVTGECT